jgi:hypothetical protein
LEESGGRSLLESSNDRKNTTGSRRVSHFILTPKGSLLLKSACCYAAGGR